MKEKIIPQFALIIGSMKSGTTNLFSLLKQHPEVSPCNQKEPEFFVKNKKFSKGIVSYYKLWDFDYGRHKVALEASTSYTKYPCFINAAERIKESGINVKFIYMMRHPIERINSQIKMSRINNWASFNVDGSINEETLTNPIAFSKYHMQITNYYQKFSREQILLLSFEQFVEDPQLVLLKICKFLDIDSSFKFDIKKAFKNDGSIYLYRDTFILRRIYRIKTHEEYLNYSKIYCGSRRMKVLKWYLKRKNNLLKSHIKYIKSELKEDLSKLKNDYGFDTSIWKL